MCVADNFNNKTNSDKDYGLVSIIMPNYNFEKHLSLSIQSVLKQTYPHWELLFVDDASTDTSLDVVRSFQDERIKVFVSEKNSGAACARNKAIEAAEGRWIAFLDSDDCWKPEKLEKQLAFMVENDIAFSYTDYDVVDDDHVVLSTYRSRLCVCTYRDILKHNHIGCLSAVYDSEKLGKVFMPIEAVKREDMACWLTILKPGRKAYCLHECLAEYRMHSKSVSANKIKMMKYQWLVYRKVEKIGLFKSLYYLASWAIIGFSKYR